MTDSTFTVRPARLDDAAAISDLYRTLIPAWQRWDTAGHVEDVPYDALTIYERWLHGGSWMSIETAAIHLSHLLRGAGLPLVAESEGRIVGYAELYAGLEAEPYGDHLHLGHCTLAADAPQDTLEDALLAGALAAARARRCVRFTANAVAGDGADRYARSGLTPLTRIQRYTLAAKSGQGFYKAVEHTNESAAQIGRWFMPVGRVGSARQQWEMLWPRTLDAIPEIRDRRIHRLHFSASGQEALVHCQPQLYAPRNAELSLWSPKPLTPQLLTALRDWSHREGYRTLVLSVTPEAATVLGAEAERDGYYVDVFSSSL